MKPLPLAVHTAAQVRALDRHAIDDLHISSYTLMTQAGEGAVVALRSCWPSKQRVAVVCGPGNNGGDGYIVARVARAMRIDVTVISVSDPAKLQGDARRAHDEFVAAGGVVQGWSDGCLVHAEVIVDAIFGTGLSRTLDADMIGCINAINDSGVPILSRTLSFIGLKLGFYLGEGPNHTGIVLYDDLDLPAGATDFVPPSALRIGEDTVAQLLPRRRRTTHKGQQGSVLVIGGGIGMAGAARMAGEAALRAGAGLVTVATWPDNVASITASRPELMCRGVESASDLAPLIERADVIAIGPGLGTGQWGSALLGFALDSDKPTIIDADALTLLAQAPCSNSKWILTPHPGEASRLLGISTADVQHDRLRAAREMARRFGGTVVLKGAGTLVVTGDSLPYICDQGNPGMASPGMGDVLTGVITGIAAQTADLPGAARAGVLVHAMAGDMAARRGERGLLATDLFGYLPTCVNPAQRF
jgi:hydroxyethylthiazole kinase-like uncharacterized protein yjeF